MLSNLLTIDTNIKWTRTTKSFFIFISKDLSLLAKLVILSMFSLILVTSYFAVTILFYYGSNTCLRWTSEILLNFVKVLYSNLAFWDSSHDRFYNIASYDHHALCIRSLSINMFEIICHYHGCVVIWLRFSFCCQHRADKLELSIVVYLNKCQCHVNLPPSRGKLEPFNGSSLETTLRAYEI